MDQSLCPQCKTAILPTMKFCPNCGYQLTVKLGVGRQIWIYLVSIFLPPLGLIWTFKYFRSSDSSIRRVAYIAAGITVISTLVTLWLTIGLINNINQQVQMQLNSYPNLGL